MDCSICLDVILPGNSFITSLCNHTFHPECLKKIKTNTCPLCRADITQDLRLLKDETSVQEPFVWDTNTKKFVYPTTRLSIDQLVFNINSLQRDLDLAYMLELEQAVIDKRNKRLDSINLYYCMNY